MLIGCAATYICMKLIEYILKVDDKNVTGSALLSLKMH